MRRFSQRNALVTLNEINITPLLDLAFVLLIIFVITTPLLEQSIKLNLPSGGATESTPPRKEDLRTVEVSPSGVYIMDGQPVSVEQLRSNLAQGFAMNPKLGVVIRIDENDKVLRAATVMDICEKIGIKRFAFATRPDKK